MASPRQIIDHEGTIRIRFTHNGYRFNLGRLGAFGDPIARAKAESIRQRICADIASGNFTVEDNATLALKYNPEASYDFIKRAKKGIEEALIVEENGKQKLIEEVEQRLEAKYHSTDKALLNLLKEYQGLIENERDAKVFLNWIQEIRKCSNATKQRYLNVLKAISPLFANIKVKVEQTPLPKPFSVEEVRRILEWFANNKYYKHYHDYVLFALSTGARPGEIIGLQWKHIDLNFKIIYFYECLARSGSSTRRGNRKPTKTGTLRQFPLKNKELLGMLQIRYENSDKNPDSLVFPSPEGKAIDDHNFSQRIWKKCLTSLCIPYRSPYICKHTFISHMLVKTGDAHRVANLTHNSKSGVQTILRNYAGLINNQELPDLY
jgi:integrase